MKGLRLQAQKKEEYAQLNVLVEHVNVYTDTQPLILKHLQSLYNCPILSSTQQSSPWVYCSIIAVDWCIIAVVNLPVGG